MDSVDTPPLSAHRLRARPEAEARPPTLRARSSARNLLPSRVALGLVLTAAAYYAGGRLDSLFSTNISPAVLWPPNAVLLTALLLTPAGRWWMYVAAVLPMDLLLSHADGAAIRISAGLFLSNSLQSLVAAALLRLTIGKDLNWNSFAAVLWFLLSAVIVAPMIAAFPGAATIGAFHGSGLFLLNWRGWFVANALTNLTFVPVLSIACSGATRAYVRQQPRTVVEAAVLLAGLLATCLWVFGRRHPGSEDLPALVYAPLPFLLWAALRFGTGGTAAAALVITIVAIVGADHRLGPFTVDSPKTNALAVQLFLFAMCAPALPLAALVRERQGTLEELNRRLTAERALAESDVVGVAYAGPSGRILDANDTFLRLIGYTREDLNRGNLTADDLEPPENNSTDPRSEFATNRAPRHWKREYARWDGSRIPVFIRSAPVEGSSGNTIYLVLDLSDHEQAKLALRESEQRFRAIFEESGIGIALVDLAGRPFECNAALQAMLGYSAEELRDRAFTEVTHPEDVDADWSLFKELMGNRRTHYQLEKRYIRKDGTVMTGRLTVSVVRDSAGEPQFAIGMVEDITRQRVAERARQESDDRLRTMADGVPVLAWMSDQTAGCTWLNQQWLDFVGQPLDQEMGQGWARHVHPEDVAHCLTVYTTAFDARRPFEMEYRLRRADGQYRWIFDRGVPRYDRDGKFLGYVGGCIDIHDRKRAEEELGQRETQLRQSVSKIQELAGRIINAQEAERTHIARELHDDMSQRLAALSIGLSAMKSRLPQNLRPEMSRLQDNALALENEIRNLSHQLHPGILQHAGLAAALKARCAELRDGGTLDVSLHVEGELGTIDPAVSLCIYRVSQEALNNVVRHAQAKHTEVHLSRRDSWLQLSVRDDGRGFDVAMARADGGLGLTSLEERVRSAGGSLTIESRSGFGTEVCAQVPVGGRRDVTAESAAGG